MRLMCLFTLLIGSLLARPAMAQQANTQTSGPTEIARTTDDLRERMLMDRIDELEKRIADLEERGPSEQPAETAAATPAPAPATAPAAAQDAAPAAAQTTPAPAPAAAPTWSIGPVDIGGVIDGYYSFNTNHPFPRVNGLYNFDTSANQFDLNLAKITLSHDADPIGFRVDFGYGRAMQIVNSFDPEPGGFDKYVEQAYVTWKPGHTGGLQLDFGKWVTSAGAEVIESYSNWNYSRSLLFALAIPYYHFGLRSAEPIGKHVTVGAQVVNGWNNLTDNNSGKTIGITTAVTYTKWMLNANYYGGPENNNDNTGWRSLIDTTVMLMPWSKLNAYVNYDYGQNRNAVGSTATTLARWQGVAAAIHWMPSSKWSFTGRGEYYDDYQGFTTGTAQILKEFTATGEYKLVKGLLWRAEYRYDASNKAFFTRGTLPCLLSLGSLTPTSCPASFGLGNSKTQNTITIGVVGYFGH